MAKVMTYTPDEEREFEEWLASRPAVVQDLARRFPPDRLYRLKDSGHRVTIAAYNQNGTLRVDVLGKFNRIGFERTVFGVEPEMLEECDLPGPDEPVGAVLTDPDEIAAAIEWHKNELRRRN